MTWQVDKDGSGKIDLAELEDLFSALETAAHPADGGFKRSLTMRTIKSRTHQDVVRIFDKYAENGSIRCAPT
eukprot:1184254-Prorocentrum_minimum.AAC.8